MRYSRQRNLIYNIVRGRSDHPTAEMIYESCKVIEPNISLGTVYRGLKVLADDGDIETLETVDKKIHYDGNTLYHGHFICEDCGEIIDLFISPPIPEEFEQLELKLTNMKCVYYGKCAECAKLLIKN